MCVTLVEAVNFPEGLVVESSHRLVVEYFVVIRLCQPVRIRPQVKVRKEVNWYINIQQ